MPCIAAPFARLPVPPERVVTADAGANVYNKLCFDDIVAIQVFGSPITYGHRMTRGRNRLHTLHGLFTVSCSGEAIMALCAATAPFPSTNHM